MFSLFGFDILCELCSVLVGIDVGVYMLCFVDMYDIGDMLVYSCWFMFVMDMEQLMIIYEMLQVLLVDVYLFGGMVGLIDEVGCGFVGVGLYMLCWCQWLFDVFDV